MRLLLFLAACSINAAQEVDSLKIFAACSSDMRQEIKKKIDTEPKKENFLGFNQNFSNVKRYEESEENGKKIFKAHSPFIRKMNTEKEFYVIPRFYIRYAKCYEGFYESPQINGIQEVEYNDKNGKYSDSDQIISLKDCTFLYVNDYFMSKNNHGAYRTMIGQEKAPAYRIISLNDKNEYSAYKFYCHTFYCAAVRKQILAISCRMSFNYYFQLFDVDWITQLASIKTKSPIESLQFLTDNTLIGISEEKLCIVKKDLLTYWTLQLPVALKELVLDGAREYPLWAVIVSIEGEVSLIDLVGRKIVAKLFTIDHSDNLKKMWWHGNDIYYHTGNWNPYSHKLYRFDLGLFFRLKELELIK